MSKFGKLIGMSLLAASFSFLSVNAFADSSTTLHKITWKGKQWEYLVEYPTDTRHLDPLRFEEVLDTAGQHGWRLVTVTGTHHFYGFYFERPLKSEKLASHRARLKTLKDVRGAEQAKKMEKVMQAYKEGLELQAKNAKGLANIDKALIRETKAIQELTKLEQENLDQQLKHSLSQGK